jgi:lipopolysaccharide transport system ATP-binding protein
VLFVSHDTGAIQSLCTRALVLENGREAYLGSTQEAVRFYHRNATHQAVVDDLSHCVRNGTGEARILSVRLEDGNAMPQVQFRMGEPLVVVVRAHYPTPIQNPIFGVNIETDSGIVVADCRSSHYGLKFGTAVGIVEYRMRIDALSLYPRYYVVEPWLTDSACLSELDWVRKAAAFLVTSGPGFLSGANVNSNHGISFIPTSWSVCSA